MSPCRDLVVHLCAFRGSNLLRPGPPRVPHRSSLSFLPTPSSGPRPRPSPVPPPVGPMALLHVKQDSLHPRKPPKTRLPVLACVGDLPTLRPPTGPTPVPRVTFPSTTSTSLRSQCFGERPRHGTYRLDADVSVYFSPDSRLPGLLRGFPCRPSPLLSGSSVRRERRVSGVERLGQ